jgi:hypothetical protein
MLMARITELAISLRAFNESRRPGVQAAGRFHLLTTSVKRGRSLRNKITHKGILIGRSDASRSTTAHDQVAD